MERAHQSIGLLKREVMVFMALRVTVTSRKKPLWFHVQLL